MHLTLGPGSPYECVVLSLSWYKISTKHGIQQQGQDFDKKFVFEEVHSKVVDRRISSERLDRAWC